MPLSSISLGDWGIVGLEYRVLRLGEGRSPADPRVRPPPEADRPYDEWPEPRRAASISCDPGGRVAVPGPTPHLPRKLRRFDRRRKASAVRLDPGGCPARPVERAHRRRGRSRSEVGRRTYSPKFRGGERNYQEQDEEAVQQMRREVAKILRVQGLRLEGVGPLGSSTAEGESKKAHPHRGPRKKPEPLEIYEPPTYVRIIWD